MRFCSVQNRVLCWWFEKNRTSLKLNGLQFENLLRTVELPGDVRCPHLAPVPAGFAKLARLGENLERKGDVLRYWLLVHVQHPSGLESTPNIRPALNRVHPLCPKPQKRADTAMEGFD